MRSRYLTCLLAALCACDAPAATSDLADLPVLTLAEELRYGHVDDPDSGFSRVGAIGVGGDGVLYAYDAGDADIRVFDVMGREALRFGRKGQGPGEFGGASTITVLDSAVWVADGGNERLSRFTRAGAFVGSVPAHLVRVGDPALRVSSRPVRVLNDGRIVGAAFTGGFRMEPGPHLALVPRLIFDETGEIADTAGTSVAPIVRMRRVEAGSQTVSLIYRQFAADPIELENSAMRIRVEQPPPVSGGEAWLSISRLDDHDEPVWTRRYRYVPRRVDGALREQTLSELHGIFFGDRVPAADGARALGEVAEFPDYLPFASSAMLGRDGTVWLLAADPDATVDWVVIDVTGEPIGGVTLPPFRGPRIMTFERERVWLAREDSLGVPYVGRYGLRR